MLGESYSCLVYPIDAWEVLQLLGESYRSLESPTVAWGVLGMFLESLGCLGTIKDV